MKRKNPVTPAEWQEAVKKALEARDIAWMRSIEKYRRSWEEALSELVREMDGGLHKVPFEPPPQEFTVQVVFGKGFGGREERHKAGRIR